MLGGQAVGLQLGDSLLRLGDGEPAQTRLLFLEVAECLLPLEDPLETKAEGLHQSLSAMVFNWVCVSSKEDLTEVAWRRKAAISGCMRMAVSSLGFLPATYAPRSMRSRDSSQTARASRIFVAEAA